MYDCLGFLHEWGSTFPHVPMCTLPKVNRRELNGCFNLFWAFQFSKMITELYHQFFLFLSTFEINLIIYQCWFWRSPCTETGLRRKNQTTFVDCSLLAKYVEQPEKRPKRNAKLFARRSRSECRSWYSIRVRSGNCATKIQVDWWRNNFHVALDLPITSGTSNHVGDSRKQSFLLNKLVRLFWFWAIYMSYWMVPRNWPCFLFWWNLLILS